MKKILSLLLAFSLALSLAACGGSASSAVSSTAVSEAASSAAASEEEAAAPLSATEPLRIAGLKGPTTMGLVNLLSMEQAGTAAMDYDLQLYGAADEIVPLLIKGELDMAAIPANLAATLYQKTNGGIQAVAVNTLGVLYVVEQGDTVHSMADLKGRTILSTGKGTTPEYVLRYLLTSNGLDPDKDVDIQYYSEATEVTAQMASTQDAIAVLPQPYVTAAGLKDDTLRVALDLTAEWDKVADTQLITGVTVVRKAYAEEHPDVVAAFLADYAQHRSGRHRRSVRGAGRGGKSRHRQKGTAQLQHRLPDRRGTEGGRLRLPAGALRCRPRRRGRYAARRGLLLDSPVTA